MRSASTTILAALLLVCSTSLGGAAFAQNARRPDLDELIRTFEQQKALSYAERQPTLERFGELPGDERAARYVAGIREGDADPGIKRRAAHVLARIGGALAQATLEREADGATAESDRADALEALSTLRPLPDRGVFRRAVQGQVAHAVKAAGVRGLAAYADDEAAAELIALLAEPARGATPPAPHLDLNRAILDGLRAMPGGVAGRVAVARVLSLPRGRGVWHKTELLPIAIAQGALASDQATAIALTREADPVIRALAAHGLSKVPPENDVVERLIDLLQDKDDAVAAAAAGALGRHAPESALAPLLKAAEKPGPLRMGAAAAALGSYPAEERAYDVLAKIVRNKRKPWQAVAGAIAALESFRERRTIALLIDVLDKVEGRLVADAHSALKGLTGQDIAAEPDDWRAWWRAVGDHFEVPAAGATKTAGKGSSVARNPTFFGHEIHSRRVCFIIDMSGSMTNEMPQDDGLPAKRVDVAKQELKRAIDGLAPNAYFNVTYFGTGFRSWQTMVTLATPAARKDAQQHVDSAGLMGGTNVFDPLEAALLDPNVDTIYLLTDGGANAGRIVPTDAILDEVRRINQGRRIAIHTISVGRKSRLLRSLADQNQGNYVER